MNWKDVEPLLLAIENLLAQWAGEEFVAAGRGHESDRKLHRKRALYFVDALYELRCRRWHPSAALAGRRGHLNPE